MGTTTDTASTREAILDAADRLLGRLGFKKTTLDDLAREAGVGRRTIYLHFESKDDVALASIDRVVERLAERLASIAASSAGASERLHDMLVERVLFRVDSVRDYYHSLDELFAVLRPAYMERRERYFERESALFARVLRQGKRSGELAFGDDAATARSLLLATNSLLPYSLTADELGARAKIQRDVEQIASLVVAGLQSPNASGRTSSRKSRN